MQAGDLRHRATLQEGKVTKGRLGQDETVWKNIAQRMPVQVEQLSGRELWNAQQIQPDITMRVRMRWRKDIASKMQLVWHDGDCDRTLPILTPPVNPDGKRIELTMFCKEAN